MNMKKKELIKKLLKEDEQNPYPGAMRDVAPVAEQPNVSLDQVVDRYLIRYEREAVPTSAMYENAFKKGSLMALFEAIMKEQEDPAADAGGGEADMGDMGGMDMGGDDAGGGGGGSTPGPTLTKTPRIDLNSFAMSVARLVNNFESLLDPKSVIINRAQQYITKNYDERTGKELIDILKNNYDLDPMTTKQSIYGDENGGDKYPTPHTVGSGGGGSLTAPSGGGGSSAGG